MRAAVRTRVQRDVVAGAIFIAVALGFGWEATNYPLGRALKMGPGFIPLTLAVVMAVLGILVAAAGLKKNEAAEPEPVPWKAILLVLAALGAFGFGGPRLGLVPTTFLCSFVIALASTRNGARAALAIAACLSAVAWAVFKLGLGVSLPTFGPVFTA